MMAGATCISCLVQVLVALHAICALQARTSTQQPINGTITVTAAHRKGFEENFSRTDSTDVFTGNQTVIPENLNLTIATGEEICLVNNASNTTWTGNETSVTPAQDNAPTTASFFTTTDQRDVIITTDQSDVNNITMAVIMATASVNLTCVCASSHVPPEGESGETARSLYYDRMRKQIWRICPPILLVVGTVGNLLSGLVMTRKALRSSITSFLLVILAVADTITLWSGLTNKYLALHHKISIRNFSNFVCKSHMFLVYWGLQFSSWVVVCVAIERFLSVFFPHKAKQWATKKTSAIVVAIVGATLLVLNSHFLFTKHIKPSSFCGSKQRYVFFASIVFHWIHLALASVVPFTILLTANLGIVLRVALSNFKKSKKSSKNSGSGVKMTSMTSTLLLVSMVFLVTTAPGRVYLVLRNDFWDVSTFSVERYALISLWYAVVLNLTYVNYSCNFFLYCITGPRFRRELLAMLGHALGHISSRVYPSEHSAQVTLSKTNQSVTGRSSQRRVSTM